MIHPLKMIVASMAVIAVSQAAFAQLPTMPSNGQAFGSGIFQAQGQAPAGGSPSPTQTLTGEAPPPKKIWSGSVEAGVNGQSGNTDVINLRTGISGQRKTDDNVFTTSMLYSLSRQEGITTQNQMLLNARDEVLFAGTPWSIFASTNIEYDQFRPYDFLIGVYGGVGYTVLDNDQTLFKLRAGAGAVKRVGGPDEKWTPEALLGFDYNYKFTDRQSFVSSLDYYPSLDHFSHYRIRAQAAYEVIVDPTMGMALRIGAQTRYDSNPGPAKRNDLNYFATLAFKF